MKSQENLNFFKYCINLIKFMSVTVFDVAPQTIGMIFFNFANEEDKLGILGFLISSFYFFFCICYNHQEIINIKSGIHFIKGDYFNFKKNIIQCIIINIIFYFINVIIVLNCNIFFKFVGLYGDFLVSVSYYVPIYCISLCTFRMLAYIFRCIFLFLI